MPSQDTPKIVLKRLAPGEYETTDGRWAISRQVADPDYGGREEWVAGETSGNAHRGDCLDPMPTLRDVRDALAAAYAAEARAAVAEMGWTCQSGGDRRVCGWQNDYEGIRCFLCGAPRGEVTK